jgi:hypothetical protein
MEIEPLWQNSAPGDDDMSDSGGALVPREPHEIQTDVDLFTTRLTEYLRGLDLPSTDITVPTGERARVFLNLRGVVDLLSDEARRGATYISKFVAACGVGLFDAALNFLWNETVADLRRKVTRLDLEYFYESVVTDSDRRRDFRTDEDLVKLDDWDLIKGCRTTGILSDVGFRHLDYIRQMRNWASAAHPNQTELTGLQLISWLETCVIEVLAKAPEGPAIEVRVLLRNIRTATLSATDVPPIRAQIERLPPDIAQSLLRALFGMYTDADMSRTAKSNIALIAGTVWNRVSEESRHEVGLKYARFAANAEIARRDAAREFLGHVHGLAYLPADTLAVELAERVTSLQAAHEGMNNFYNELTPARALAAAVPQTGMIPNSVRPDLVRVVTLAKIGNAYGVSFAAETYYDRLIALFGEREIQEFVRLVRHPEVASQLQFGRCATAFKRVATNLRARTANAYTQGALDIVLRATEEQLPNIGRTGDMQRALDALERARAN